MYHFLFVLVLNQHINKWITLAIHLIKHTLIGKVNKLNIAISEKKLNMISEINLRL